MTERQLRRVGIEGKENTAACAVEMQRRQYTAEQFAKAVIETMFTTFVQQANCDNDVKVHG